jgi:hypothetical protein
MRWTSKPREVPSPLVEGLSRFRGGDMLHNATGRGSAIHRSIHPKHGFPVGPGTRGVIILGLNRLPPL